MLIELVVSVTASPTSCYEKLSPAAGSWARERQPEAADGNPERHRDWCLAMVPALAIVAFLMRKDESFCVAFRFLGRFVLFGLALLVVLAWAC